MDLFLQLLIQGLAIGAYALGSALNVPAAAIALFSGGVALGVVTSLAVCWFPASFRQTLAFAVLAAFLLWRPSGLLGLQMRRV
jgi:branched-subunit amino acid ABC-type transport system permease component